MPFPIAALAGLAIEAVPSLVRWIAGDDAGDVADKVSGIAKRVTGASTDEEAVAAIRANPELFAKFQSDLAALNADLEKAYLADRQDARSMSVERAKISRESARSDAIRKNAMILGDVVGLCVCLAVLTFVPNLPGEVIGIISTIAGIFGLGLRDAHQFEFGSSRGSKEKDYALAGAMRRD